MKEEERAIEKLLKIEKAINEMLGNGVRLRYFVISLFSSCAPRPDLFQPHEFLSKPILLSHAPFHLRNPLAQRNRNGHVRAERA
jgi:hypothetical protein